MARHRDADQRRHRTRETRQIPPPVQVWPPWLPPHLRVGVGLTLVLSVAAVLRFYGLAYRDLWFDELGSVAMATRGDLWASEGGNPPLFFALLKLWIGAAGASISAVRALSAPAGIGAVAALFWVAAELRLPPAVRWWGAVLLALSPLHLYYSQEARAYTLLILLLLVALGSFLRAIRTGDRRWWVAHGVSLLAGLYTHNLMIPMVAAFWAAGLVLRVPRRGWLTMAFVHGLAVLAYAPWIPRLWQQSGGESHYWIADLMGRLTATGLVVGTIEAFSLGGQLPEHVPFPANAGVAPWALFVFGVALLMAIATGFRALRRTSAGLARESLAVLAIFSIWPVLFLLMYTWLGKPLYLVGRYDLPAQPAFLLLIAIGLVELGARFRVMGLAGRLLPSVAVLILASCALYPKLALGNTAAPGHASTRLAQALRTWAVPTDLVVALDVSKPLASYAVTHSGQPLHVEAFPKMSLHQFDLTGFNQRLRAHAPAFQREASSLAAAAQGRRIWLVYSRIYDTSATIPTGYEVLRRLLMSELRHHVPREDELGVALRRNNVVLLEPRLASNGLRRP